MAWAAVLSEFSNHLDRAFGQRSQKRFAIALGEDAIIQYHDYALVVPCANEAANALAEFEDGFRKGKFHEWISAARFDCLNARFNERMVGDGKWKTRDDHV